MHELSILVSAAQAGRTVQSLARGELKVSFTRFKRMKFNSGILVDGRQQRSDYRLQAGEELRLRFDDAQASPVAAGTQPLMVLHEDDELLVVDKPAPLPALRSRQGGETLENRVYSHLGSPEGFVFRPVNRLDKGTSGVMLVAKNAHAQQLLQRQFLRGEVVKEYLAVVSGRPPQAEGLVELPIGHGPGIRRQVDPAGRPARTAYRLLCAGTALSLLGLRLYTGRTHQIRVHMAALGCPVFGDFLYGEESTLLPGRFALHACGLAFRHPISGEALRLRSPMPPELSKLPVKPGDQAPI